jgi:hypothetical protein
MNNDVSQDILNAVIKDFEKKYKSSKAINKLILKIDNGTASHMDSYQFAQKVSDFLNYSIQKNMTGNTLPNGRLYYHIAESVLTPLLKNNHALVTNYAKDVQTMINKKDDIPFKGRTSKCNVDRIEGICSEFSRADKFEETQAELSDTVENYTLSCVDDTIRENARFLNELGYHEVVERRAHNGACRWCRSIEGTYDYSSKMDTTVFKRHKRCKCVVFVSRKPWQRQDAWSKKKYEGVFDTDRII